MKINANTRIAPILKNNPSALEAIISVSSKFEKLRNPLLRKVMAGRTSLMTASKHGGCSLEDLFNKLEPLGFEIDRETKATEEEKKPLPAFIISLTKEGLIELDVRPVLASGSDPLNIILEKVKVIQPGQVLKIINTFEPTPLISMLQKKGFETYVDKISDNLIETYFHKTTEREKTDNKKQSSSTNWDKVIERFQDHVQTIDVRHLEMPQPMLKILESLDQLPVSTALYVYHKRIPVFLLPDLAERGFEYRVKEIADGEVHLLIYKD